MTDAPIPLHRNESYWLLDDERLGALRMQSVRTLSTYPEYGDLTRALSAYTGRHADEILITPGSDAGIALLAGWCARSGRTAILPIPTFYGYERILTAHGVETRYVLFDASADCFAFPERTVSDALGETANAVLFLCQPNNPLGSLIDPSVVDALLALAAKRGAMVVVDEAYAEFDNPSLIGRTDEHLVVLRTFSKGFGLAGARVGYIVASEYVIDRLRPLQLPWPVAHPSVATSLQALELADVIAERRVLLMEERESFLDALAAIPGCRPLPSRTNFIYADVGDGDRVAAVVAREGIAVAAGSSLSFRPEAQKLLRPGIRMSVPSPDDRERVLRILTGSIAAE